MATATALLTIADFLALPATGRPTELVRGKIVEVPPPGPSHGTISFQISYLVGQYLVPRGLGEILTNHSGVVTRRDPDSLGGADVAFYRAARLPPVEDWTGHFEFPSNFVVEVRSPSDRWTEVVQKAGE